MCILIVVRNGYRSYPLVVAANRDELLDRLRTDWGREPPTWPYRHRERPADGHDCGAPWQPELRLPLLSE